MPAPSEYPEWADGGSAQLVEPVSGKKQVGWTSGEKPANQILNWWQNLVFQWVEWLDSYTQTIYADLVADIASLTATLTADVAALTSAKMYATIMGDGSDGAITFDGSSTVIGLSPSSSTYTLERDVACTACTVDSGVTIITNGFRILCSGVLTINGTVQWNGNTASSSTGASALNDGGPLGWGSAGGDGSSSDSDGSAGAGVVGTGAYPTVPSQSVTTGSNGGTCCGGAGGGNGTYGGGDGSTTAMGVAHGYASVFDAVRGRTADGSVFGGGTGGGGGGGNSSGGGGGGSGAGVIVLACGTLAGTGTIEANGGAGHGITNGAGGYSGGGGGGGGVIIIAFGTSTFTGTVEANGGIHGGGGIEVGDGGAGGYGGAGLVLPFNLSEDGTTI